MPVLEDGSNAYHQRVLVPGCGLARLPIDICCEGYSVEGNEFSAFMLMASNYILNGVGIDAEDGRSSIQAYKICPYVDKVCNVLRVSDVLKPITIPDVPACELLRRSKFHYVEEAAHNGHVACSPPAFPRFSMSAGDFNDVYGPMPTSDPTPASSHGDASSNAGVFDAVVTCFFLDTAPVVMQVSLKYVHSMCKCIAERLLPRLM